jgi:ABC-type transporter Mla subunit MlaD
MDNENYRKYKRRIITLLAFLYQKIRLFLIFLLLILITVAGYKIYKEFFGYHIVAEFKELGPMQKSMPVYYKGFKVGYTGDIKPSVDFSAIMMRLILNTNLNDLPDNLTAKVKKFEQPENEQSYIELVYPDSPSKYRIKRGSVIKGKTNIDIASFMNAQAESGSLTIISDNMSKTLQSAQKTSDEIGKLVVDLQVVLEENRKYLLATTQGFAQTSTNLSKISEDLKQMSVKFNNSIDEQKINGTLSSIEKTAENINESAQNVKLMTENLNAASANVNQITDGVKNTMSKRFGTMKLLFGTPVEGQ